MRILIVAQYFPPDIGGAATRAYNVAKGLVSNGCDVTVIAAFPHYPHGKIPKQYRWTPFKIEYMENFKVVRTFMPPIKSEGFSKRIILKLLFALSALAPILTIREVDGVFACSWIPGIIYGKIKKAPVAINIDDLTLEDVLDLNLISERAFPMRLGRIIYKVFYQKGDFVVPISPGYVNTIVEKYSVKRDRIHVIRGGVDTALFRQLSSRHNDKFKIVYSGAFSVAYDFDLVLDAAKIISGETEEVEFILQGDGELLNHMHSKIKNLDLKNVIVLNTVMSRSEVSQFISDADVLLLPLKDFGRPYLGISTKLYEYQAAGKPIICCAEGQPAKYIQETGSGLVVHLGEAGKLAEAVLYLYRNRAKAKVFGENGRQFVETNLTINAIGTQMVRLFRNNAL